MKKWEDIVRDKMEEFNEALPESVYAEFQALRSCTTPVPSPKHHPIVWAVVPAVTAGLVAIVLLWRKPSTTNDQIQTIQQTEPPITVLATETVKDSNNYSFDIVKSVKEEPVHISAQSQEDRRSASAIPIKKEECFTADTIESDTADHDSIAVSESPQSIDKQTPQPINTASSPFIPEKVQTEPIKIKILPTAGFVAGSGLLAAITATIIRSGSPSNTSPVSTSTGESQSSPPPPIDGSPGGTTTPGDSQYSDTSPSSQATADSPICHFPFKAGVSIGIPLAERLKITTGLDYSFYKTSFTNSNKKQVAHYLGLPIRLDLSLASNRWIDIYLGGGSKVEYCLGATCDGTGIKGDGLSFSLLGAGGICFHITKFTGLYIEPELSWTIPLDNLVLETYRNSNPLMFSVNTGIRINIEK